MGIMSITLGKVTLEVLRDLLNDEFYLSRRYHTDPASKELFEALRVSNSSAYFDGKGNIFPWKYIDDKLNEINGTPEIEECIKKLFDPRCFDENERRRKKFEEMIVGFNEYLVRDGLVVVVEANDEVAIRTVGDKVSENT
jgi:hypothetical protein